MQFYILSHHDILATSVLEVKTKADVLSPLLGARRGAPCGTCGGTLACPGHWGHIALHSPVVLPQFREPLRRFLAAACRGCGSTEGWLGRECRACGAETKGHPLTPDEATDVARWWRSNKDVPGRLIANILPVPPLCLRPGIVAADFLTVALRAIVVANAAGEPLEGVVSAYYASKARDRLGSPIRCLSVILSKKDGWLRGVATEKRVDHSARAVLSPHCQGVEVRVAAEVSAHVTTPDGLPGPCTLPL